MPTFVSLLRFTQKGIENVEESPLRIEKAREVALACGVDLKTIYFTIGQYDLVIIGKAPTDEAYATALLATTSGGAVRAESLRAFTEEEYRGIIGAIPKS